MSDLIERLRKMAATHERGFPVTILYSEISQALDIEAADRIEALERENAQLRADMMEIQKKAMWLRGEQAYREFPRYVIRAVDLSTRPRKPTEAEGREG